MTKMQPGDLVIVNNVFNIIISNFSKLEIKNFEPRIKHYQKGVLYSSVQNWYEDLYHHTLIRL